MKIVDGLVSVIMPLYNAEKYVSEAIESILSQTYENIELIIVDDCSRDSSPDIANKFADRDTRIRFFRNEKNIGVAKTRNRAIHEARGEYVACLDNDDVAMPDRIAEQVNFLKTHPDYGLVASDVEIIDENSRPIAMRYYPHTDQEIRQTMLRVNPVANPACLFRRAVFEELGDCYDESACPVEDYEFVLRVARKHKIANFDRILTKYRISTAQAKNVYLKKTIRLTLKIQRNAIMQGFSDTCFNRLYRLGLGTLLWMPDRFVLWLFKKTCYTKPRQKATASGLE